VTTNKVTYEISNPRESLYWDGKDDHVKLLDQKRIFAKQFGQVLVQQDLWFERDFTFFFTPYTKVTSYESIGGTNYELVETGEWTIVFNDPNMATIFALAYVKPE